MKNWLIRTSDHQILGPVSLNKVRELLEKKSIRRSDEICSGNGYWFYIRESELVEKYVTQGQKQSFNPVSEARSVLSGSKHEVLEQAENEDITLVGLTLDALKESASLKDKNPKDEPTEVKAIKSETGQVPVRSIEINKEKAQTLPKVGSSLKGQRFLFFIAFLFFVLAIVSFIYRKTIIKEIISSY